MVREVFLEDSCIFDLQGTSKDEVYTQMCAKLLDAGRITDAEAFKKALYVREEQGPTGLGDGIAIPHGKSSCVQSATVILGVHKQGIKYESLDDQPVSIFFMIAVPESSNDEHLSILASLCRKMVHREFIEGIKTAETGAEVAALL